MTYQWRGERCDGILTAVVVDAVLLACTVMGGPR